MSNCDVVLKVVKYQPTITSKQFERFVCNRVSINETVKSVIQRHVVVRGC